MNTFSDLLGPEFPVQTTMNLEEQRLLCISISKYCCSFNPQINLMSTVVGKHGQKKMPGKIKSYIVISSPITVNQEHKINIS